MISNPASERLVRLFERELRDFSTQQSDSAAPPKAPKRVSGELDHEVVQFASEGRTNGRTPEQMLIELMTPASLVASVNATLDAAEGEPTLVEVDRVPRMDESGVWP